MATNSNISIFQKLEKYSGELSNDLPSWLRGFERCCVIAGKTEDLVKGQLLLLCLSGRALAVAEGLEEEKGTPQNFTELKAKLEAVFNSAADKELKQEEFEKRHMKIDETEEEFMLDLVKLYRSANPDSADPEKCRNVKRKFLNGIPSNLKRNVFVFCNDPHSTTVSVDNLLEAVRKAKLYISERDNTSESINVVESERVESESSILLKAIDGLRQSLDTHIRTTTEQFNEQDMRINAVTNDRTRPDIDERRERSSSSFNHEQSNRGNERSSERGRPTRRGNRGGRDPPTCYNCRQPNHIARDCRAPRLNERGRLSR